MIRKVVTRSPNREVGIVNAGWLLSHPVQHESHLEKRFVMVALACPVVVDVKHQPIEIALDEPERKYTADFELTFQDGDSVIVEVKPTVFIQKNAPRLVRVRTKLAEAGRRFLVVTEEQIDASGISARALLLMRYGRLALDPVAAAECKQLLDQQFGGSAQARELAEAGIPESAIWALVARHQLRISSALNIDPLEQVSLPEDPGGCYVFFCSWFGIEEG